ncbi:MAG: hypothetical protein WC364_10535 [Eubacteriales bacterium]|jgi:predicted  nucleic acid-binding Zn-ribbon protein
MINQELDSQLTSLIQKLNDLNDQYDSIEDKIEDLEHEKDAIELEICATEAGIEKVKKQMHQVGLDKMTGDKFTDAFVRELLSPTFAIR